MAKVRKNDAFMIRYNPLISGMFRVEKFNSDQICFLALRGFASFMTLAPTRLVSRSRFLNRFAIISCLLVLLVGCVCNRTECSKREKANQVSVSNSATCASKQGCRWFTSKASTTQILSRSVAGLNALATVFLITGYVCIRRGNRAGHGKAMGLAFVTSALFLAVYLASKVHLWVSLGRTNIMYRPDVGLTWDKCLYYIILFPHIVLAILVTPFIIRAILLARAGRFEDHKRLTRWVFPVWLYVSITGVIVWAFMECSGSLAAVTALK